MQNVFILVLSFLLHYECFATAQYTDKIFYNGKEYFLHSNPLEKYFDLYPDKRPTEGIKSSALLRGYVATFEIKNDTLVVKDIEIQIRDTVTGKPFDFIWKSVYAEMFAEKDKPVDWLSGVLVLPFGKMVQHIEWGYATVYENYLLLEIDRGLLKRNKEFTHETLATYKSKQFVEFRKTQTYPKLKKILRKNGSNDKYIDRSIREVVIDYTSKIVDE